MERIKFAITLLIICSGLLHIFSIVVSCYPANEFLSHYIPLVQLRWLAIITGLLIIELGVFAFLRLALTPNILQDQAKMIVYVLLGIFIVSSATLTTIGAGKAAVTLLPAIEQLPEPHHAGQLRAQLAADNARLAAINKVQGQRKGGWLTPAESAELPILQERINNNSIQLSNIVANWTASNQQAIQAHQRSVATAEQTHNSLGFLSQLLLVLVTYAAFWLKKSEQSVSELLPEPTPVLPEDKIFRVNIPDDTVRKVARLRLEKGYSHEKISQELSLSKGTVTKCLQMQFWELVGHDVDTNASETLEKLGLKPFKELNNRLKKSA
jgi:hypothetical protein